MYSEIDCIVESECTIIEPSDWRGTFEKLETGDKSQKEKSLELEQVITFCSKSMNILSGNTHYRQMAVNPQCKK